MLASCGAGSASSARPGTALARDGDDRRVRRVRIIARVSPAGAQTALWQRTVPIERCRAPRSRSGFDAGADDGLWTLESVSDGRCTTGCSSRRWLPAGASPECWPGARTRKGPRVDSMIAHGDRDHRSSVARAAASPVLGARRLADPAIPAGDRPGPRGSGPGALDPCACVH